MTNQTTQTTPAMQQYYDIKKEYNDSIIFFRMWDFYEMFWIDAEIAHKVLWINVTSRNKNAANPEKLAGFPYHAKDKYLPMLISAWYKVAIVEQVSDPTLKWIVKREVVRVVTPATISLEWESYENITDSNIIISITKQTHKFGLSYINISTNKWESAEFISFEDLAKNLYKISPLEVVLDKKLFNDENIKNILEKKYSLNIYYYEFREDAYKKLTSHFKTKNLTWFWLEEKTEAIFASALLLSYLELNQKQSLSNLSSMWVMSFWDYLELDDSTLKNLDIIYNFATQSHTAGTLFWLLNKTKTSMWKRLLRENLLKPLKDKAKIDERLCFLQEFYNDKILLDKVRDKLTYVADIDIILNRLYLQRSTPKDLLNLKKSLESILEIFEIINNSDNKKLKKLIWE